MMDPLMMAIHGTSDKTLRSVMNRMCKSSPEVRRFAEPFLLVLGSDLRDSPEKGQKRKLDDMSSGSEMVPRYDTCANCEEEFDVGVNKGKSCAWHTGKKEGDEDADVWDDYEDLREGPMEGKEDDPEFGMGLSGVVVGSWGMRGVV
jgi:hypothetical protein